MERLKIFLAMLTNALALGLGVLLLLDLRNPYMGFLSSVPSRVFMACLCVCAVATATLYIAGQRRK
jgi:hypothetical protein